MKFFTFILLVLIANHVDATESFVSYCKVGSVDKYHTPSSLLVLEYDIDKRLFNYYEIYEGKVYSKGGGSDEYFEFRGGVRSTTLGLDTVKYLKTLPFRLMQVAEDPVELTLADPPVCNIDYARIEYYESGEWRKEE